MTFFRRIHGVWNWPSVYQVPAVLRTQLRKGKWIMGRFEIYHFYYYDTKTILSTFQACGKCFETDESIDGFVSLCHRLYCLLVVQLILIIKLVVIPIGYYPIQLMLREQESIKSCLMTFWGISPSQLAIFIRFPKLFCKPDSNPSDLSPAQRPSCPPWWTARHWWAVKTSKAIIDQHQPHRQQYTFNQRNHHRHLRSPIGLTSILWQFCNASTTNFKCSIPTRRLKSKVLGRAWFC